MENENKQVNNQVIMIGFLKSKKEIRIIDNGKQVINAQILFIEKYKNAKDEEQITYNYFDITGWNMVAEEINNLNEDDLIKIIGKLNQKNWVDKDEKKRTSVELVVFEVEKLKDANIKG